LNASMASSWHVPFILSVTKQQIFHLQGVILILGLMGIMPSITKKKRNQITRKKKHKLISERGGATPRAPDGGSATAAGHMYYGG
jgi:hypothetical protein